MKNKYKKILAVATAFAVAVAGLMIQPNRTYADGEGTELLSNTTFANGDNWVINQADSVSYNNNSVSLVLPILTGGNVYDKEIYQHGFSLENGKYYAANVTVTSSVTRKIGFKIQKYNGNWAMLHQRYLSVEAGVPYTFHTAFIAHGDYTDCLMGLNLGKIDANIDQTSTVTVSNISLQEYDTAPEGFVDTIDLEEGYCYVAGSEVTVEAVNAGNALAKRSVYVNAKDVISSVVVNGNTVTSGGNYDNYAEISGAGAWIYFEALTERTNTIVFNCSGVEKTLTIINTNVAAPEEPEPETTTSSNIPTNTIRTEDEVMVSDSISIQGFQIKTNFAEGADNKNVAFRAIAKCPSIGSELTLDDDTYEIKAHGIIYTVDDNGSGYKKDNVQTKSDTKLNLASAEAVSGGRTRYFGSAPNDGRTFGITSTDLALIPSLNTNNDGHDYYVFTMNGLKSCMTHSYHVRAFAIVTKDETDYIVYGTKAAVTSVPQIADNIYRNNKSPNVQGHQYLFSFLSNALNTGYDIPTTNPYYRTQAIEYGWDGNLHEEETTTKFEGMTFVSGS